MSQLRQAPRARIVLGVPCVESAGIVFIFLKGLRQIMYFGRRELSGKTGQKIRKRKEDETVSFWLRFCFVSIGSRRVNGNMHPEPEKGREGSITFLGKEYRLTL